MTTILEHLTTESRSHGEKQDLQHRGKEEAEDFLKQIKTKSKSKDFNHEGHEGKIRVKTNSKNSLPQRPQRTTEELFRKIKIKNKTLTTKDTKER